MSGISIEQAKRSLQMALNRLRPADRFNVIQFNSVTDVLFSAARHANFANVKQARRYVQRLQANGGTNIGPALDAALGLQNDDELMRQVIFLTDGSVGNETALFDKIKQQLGRSRLFTIGIGSAPNSYFMRKAAQFGRGSFTYISDVNEVKEKMSALFSKLESPVMSDLNIIFNNNKNETAELWPKRIPDLYRGEPVVIAVRTTYPLESLEITGQRANAPWKNRIELNQEQNGNGIGVFWARNKIASLMDSLHDGADKQTVRKDVTNVALKHHLVSRYTSLVAVDVTPTRSQEDLLVRHDLPVNLPYGQSMQKIFGRLPQTATSSEINLLSGIILLLVAWLSLRFRLLSHLTIVREKA
jgi:Ca-activated chloride channel family protein